MSRLPPRDQDGGLATGHRRTAWRAAWQDALRLTALGFDWAVPIGGGVVLGHVLDRHFQTGLRGTVVLLFLGAGVGYTNVVRQLQREIERDRQRSVGRDQEGEHQ
jgi:F0F1-type ATP synthase assembly protein I